MAVDDTGSSTGPDTSKDADKSTPSGSVLDDKGTGKDVATGSKSGDAKTDEDVSGLKKALSETRKERDALAKAAREAQLAKLPELERATVQVNELTQVVDKLTLENRRYKVAMKSGLPWSIGKRLTGDTDEDMEADAAELLKTYKIDESTKILKDDPKNKRPPNDAKKDGPAGRPDMNAALRALRRG